LEKEKAKLQTKLTQIQNKLSNDEFLSKAPDRVIDKNRAELSAIQSKIEKLVKNLLVLKTETAKNTN
ncbi:MAG: hypothetical protein H8E81_09780, partial [Deltaproteobacteria bacterium]|nr:hypothetical protein [Deltaproteobacteria bacterium]